MSDVGRSIKRVLVVGLVVTAGFAAVASVSGAATGGARVTVRSSEFGKVLFGPSGKVLYTFGADKHGTSTCYGACAAAWPPLLTTAAPRAGLGVQSKLLGTTKRKNGRLQVTYNGHPLYYYVSDKVGKVMCQHANMHGGLWLIIKPSGVVDMAKSAMHM